MHTDPHRSWRGTDDRADLVERETRSIAHREQMLLLRLETTDHRVQSRRSFAGQELLLDVRLETRGFRRERLQPGPAVHVTDSVPGDLEQPTSESTAATEAPELRERSCEHHARDVL